MFYLFFSFFLFSQRLWIIRRVSWLFNLAVSLRWNRWACCRCRLSRTLWQRRRATCREALAKKITLGHSAVSLEQLLTFHEEKRLRWVPASPCLPSTVPCCILAGGINICRPALIPPLCTTQSVTLDSLTHRMFHGGTVISTFSAQLVDCQLQLFPLPIPPPYLHFFPPLPCIRPNQRLPPIWVQR